VLGSVQEDFGEIAVRKPAYARNAMYAAMLEAEQFVLTAVGKPAAGFDQGHHWKSPTRAGLSTRRYVVTAPKRPQIVAVLSVKFTTTAPRNNQINPVQS